MSEVEKMYKNAGVGYRYWCSYKDTWCPIEDIGKFNPKCAKTEVTMDCDARSPIAQLPKFTPEKQLSLIKWLAKTRSIHISFLIDKWVLESIVRYSKRYDTFSDALTGYVNQIWQDLTEEEQEQIRSILNG